MTGGLIVGTLLSLLDIPIMHTFVDDFIRWLNKTFRGREWHWPVTEGNEAAEDEGVRPHHPPGEVLETQP